MSEQETETSETESETETVVYVEENWLHKMDGYLAWKIIAPRINNPYEKSLPDRMLVQMAQNREKVRQVLKIRCLCDGHEVLRIDNLETPILFTDHPCLSVLPRVAILEHLSDVGVGEEVERVIDRVQSEIREELKKREAKAASELPGGAKTIAQIRAEREKQAKAVRDAETAAQGPRRVIIRRG